MRTKGGLRKKLALLLIVAVVAATTKTCPAQDSQQDRLSLRSAAASVRFSPPSQAVMDFDGDQFPDQAELTSNGPYKHIHLRLSSPWVTNLHFSTDSLQPGSIHAEDIDHDGDNDLIWVSDRQPTQSWLWLNSGIGKFTQVADASAYITDIKRIIADGRQNDLFALSADEQSLATETSEQLILKRSDSGLPVTPHSITIPGFGRNCAAELSPCVTRYPKRGPPTELS
ncbi:MAG: VCBS repeat-containing protein [Blastocatellia bacterium]|nr:VCBS repeat-containing protein [Blastocatellia bacterium]